MEMLLAPLNVRPRVRRLYPGFHGHRPAETYRMDCWVMHLYKYEGELIVNGTTFPLEPGSASVIAPGAIHEHRFKGNSMHIYAIVELPDADVNDQELVQLPVVRDLSERFNEWWTAFEAALGYWVDQPGRADALVWSLLWELAEPETPRPTVTAHWHARQALHYIEQHFAEPLSVAAVAKEVGISQRHLTSLFREATGMTMIAYLRQRRVTEASRLLTHSDLPVKVIAARVGIPDLQAFNKTVRAFTGRSPRALRAVHHENK